VLKNVDPSGIGDAEHLVDLSAARAPGRISAPC